MIPLVIKKWLSHVVDIQVDYRESALNGDLIVFLAKGKYQLCSANAIYSYEDRYDNFGNIFRDYIDMSSLSGNRVLILGLGLGSVPVILDKVDPNHWLFTAIDIDPVIIELASIYGYPKLLSPIQTICSDAVVFCQTSNETFDLICIDIFIDDVMPENVKTTEFLRTIDKRLAEGGMLVLNTLAYSEEHRLESKTYFEEVFTKVFPKGILIHTHKNHMLINKPEFLK